MACFWSESNKMSYWWKLPLKSRDTIKIKDKEFCITNVEIVSTMNQKQPMFINKFENDVFVAYYVVKEL